MEDPVISNDSSKNITSTENKIIDTDTSQNYTYHIIVLIIIVIVILIGFSSTCLNSAIIGGALLSQSRSNRRVYGTKITTPGPSCLKSFSVVPFKKRKTVSFNMRKNKTCVFEKRDKPVDIKKNSVKYRKR